MARGREQFRKYKRIILTISAIISLFPQKMRMKYFEHIRNRNGKLGMVLRYATLRTLAVKVGDNVSIHPGAYILNPQNLSIGCNVSIHPMCYLECIGGLKIGDNVSIAHAVTVMTANHNYKDYSKPINDQGIENRPTTIEDNVWIGAKATILGGVTVHTGTVIAAGGVVCKTFDDNAVLAGVPAQVLRRR